LRLLGLVDEIGAVGAQVDFLLEDRAHELALALEGDRLGQLLGQDLRRVALLVLLEELDGDAQVPQLVVEEALPDRLDARIALGLHAAVVVVHLARLVQHPLLEPGLVRVDDRLVLRDVLLLDVRDLGVELPRHGVGVRRPDVHVEVVGLLLGRHDRERVHLGEGMRLLAVVRSAQLVLGRAVLVHGGPAGQDVRVALKDVVRILALEPVHERGVAVHMVEVLEQAVPVDLREVLVGLGLRHGRGDLDGDLLVADRGLERRVVGAQEPVDHRRLVLLLAPHLRQRQLQGLVHPRAGMLEAQRFEFLAVHQDDAYAREGVVVELADRRLYQLLPGEVLLLERDAFIAQ